MFDVTDWTRNNCNTYIVQCAKKNHTQKVLKNHTQNVVEKLVKKPFYENSNISRSTDWNVIKLFFIICSS